MLHFSGWSFAPSFLISRQRNRYDILRTHPTKLGCPFLHLAMALSIASMLISPLALVIAGPFAYRFGIQPWFLTAGISCILMGTVGFFIPT